MNINEKHDSYVVEFFTEDSEKIMKTNLKENRNSLLILTGKGLKYFLLTLASFAISLVIFQILGISSLAQTLGSFNVWIWFARVAGLLFALFALAMIVESWR
ncbi:hypothetical protein [Umezakia ovalisporum]|jgi:hypothetical protein|uniref:Uncharacterized protein n=2 Tax=Umezakia ovalisporum TaxID=75695 RepID=A0AA43GZZ2_9CYAN|nr:hypothetical protein [Umezakia ovalisporum]MDH6057745.1 hypothetical protein [Umezakia ovalisporum FSS-43]MDH6064777.1 hypothetical protein [Umezakia ovalisporum FSS-62]MDH6067377.1 hypothetical protein [Umezakia ovalisporum APH033B]MDH6070332.1 hypothetical protein [Umezakia ovalisporum CobakiLakeA]MDH6074650.1 hypothetical protein [Umezakia ovalisporum CS-1034]